MTGCSDANQDSDAFNAESDASLTATTPSALASDQGLATPVDASETVPTLDLSGGDQASPTVPSTLATTVQSSETTAALTPTTAPFVSQPEPDGMKQVELTLVSLINELRGEPLGRLQRPALEAPCDPFYVIQLDPANNQPIAAPPLAVHEQLSIDVARAWSRHMANSGTLLHQSLPDVGVVAQGMGLDAVWAENVASVHAPVGTDQAETAMALFNAWQSVPQHYCALVARNVTHVGIGVVDGPDHRAYATLNLATAAG